MLQLTGKSIATPRINPNIPICFINDNKIIRNQSEVINYLISITGNLIIWGEKLTEISTLNYISRLI